MSGSESITVTTMLAGAEVRAGQIHRTRASASFVYDQAYLQHKDAFALAPALGLHAGPQPIFPANPFSDSAPDTWGRKVLTRAAGRRLDELSLLLGVNDESRQGATRFWVDGTAVADGDGVPVERELSDLLRIADAIQRGDRHLSDGDARRLFRATGSLGGARPKANVRRGEALWLAKFPKPQGDHWDVMAWEAATGDVMEAAGISTPSRDVLHVDVDGVRRTILLLQRFDRDGSDRIPYLSAMTALEASDGEGGDWLDLAEWAVTNGADTRELWRRGVFGMLVGNTDDHLRNHGFLRRGRSWVLAPAFDVNPTPLEEAGPHQLALLGEASPGLTDWLSRDVLSLFRMADAEVHAWLSRLAAVLSDAPRRAAARGADPRSIEMMTSRFTQASGALAEVTSR